MAITNGSFLTHPSFGLCKVTGIEQGKVCIVTEAGEKKTLLSSYVQKSCVEVATAHVDPASPLVAPKPRAAPNRPRRAGGSIGTGRSRACSHCGKPLNRSYYSADGRSKSCPNCSAERGSEQHVFYPHPRAFGTSDARSNDNTPDGVQSYCQACRERERGSGGIACDSVDQ